MDRLQYLDFGGNQINDIDLMCDGSFGVNLKYLTLWNNPIQNISKCVYDYWSGSNLKQLDLSLVYKSFRVELLNMSDIMELNVFGTAIDMDVFDNDDDIVYKEETRYYFQNNPICDEFMQNRAANLSLKLHSFLKDTDACINNNYCDFSNIDEDETSNLCQPKLWNNDICDKECNSLICSYDGGDCY